ncbi:MmgE/PrpD family protein [Burkholderia seminalis]|uniref:MmgE/PrpD family protein n=2 Tax=Burkholderia cepacia complex TaxID=87882 RepID=A0A8A8DEV3_9BURK|nr:MmgE/PrpD family protein [Burkholderia seminalis]QTO23324.1 MmgE/PrpD family protein [Burkholderia seminalis]
MTTPSFTQRLASFAADTSYDDISRDTRHATRRLIEDTLGCCVAAFEMPSSTVLSSVIGGFGGVPEATVLVSGQKLPAVWAGYINAHLGDVIDAEDTLHYKAHISAPVLGAALAVAERERASGKDLLAAVALGYDVAARIALSLKGLTINADGTFRFAPVTGYSAIAFGSTVAAARLLGLDEAQMHHAFGLAFATAPLPSSSKFGIHRPRPMAKNTMYGTLGHVGVMAALLAKAGFTGERNVLDGDQGFWRVVGSLDCNWEVLTERLGERWLIEEVSYKPYPGCRFLHSPLDMFIALKREHAIELDEIERIEVDIHGAALQRHMDDANVETMIDACFSMPYLLAAAALRGQPGPDWHTPEARESEAMKRFAAKVKVGLEPRAAAAAAEDLRTLGHNARMPASIRIHARGRTFGATADYAHGDAFTPHTRMSDAELDAKFANFCRAHLSDAQIATALGVLHQLDEQASLQNLIGCLVASEYQGEPQHGR